MDEFKLWLMGVGGYILILVGGFLFVMSLAFLPFSMAVGFPLWAGLFWVIIGLIIMGVGGYIRFKHKRRAGIIVYLDR